MYSYTSLLSSRSQNKVSQNLNTVSSPPHKALIPTLKEGDVYLKARDPCVVANTQKLHLFVVGSKDGTIRPTTNLLAGL